MPRVLVTGGCGFIGCNFLNRFVPKKPDWQFINLDSLTYAGNAYSLASIAKASNYTFVHGDIRDEATVQRVFAQHDPQWVVHLAAESHVDRSILGPRDFLETNILGTFVLLEAARGAWQGKSGRRFHHVSTDEVYGSLGPEGAFVEETPYDPSSPYSASKASSDHLVRAYHRTYGLPVTLSNCSNNYGAYQFPEKLIPLMILNAMEGKPLPLYGDGSNVRDWLFVEDHCDAILDIVSRGREGETYNVGGQCERTNLTVVQSLCDEVGRRLGRENLRALITFVPDRPGHDFRYAIDCSKLESELGWSPSVELDTGLARTVDWYLEHLDWVEQVRTGDYREWLRRNYDERGEP